MKESDHLEIVKGNCYSKGNKKHDELHKCVLMKSICFHAETGI